MRASHAHILLLEVLTSLCFYSHLFMFNGKTWVKLIESTTNYSGKMASSTYESCWKLGVNYGNYGHGPKRKFSLPRFRTISGPWLAIVAPYRAKKSDKTPQLATVTILRSLLRPTKWRPSY